MGGPISEKQGNIYFQELRRRVRNRLEIGITIIVISQHLTNLTLQLRAQFDTFEGSTSEST